MVGCSTENIKVSLIICPKMASGLLLYLNHTDVSSPVYIVFHLMLIPDIQIPRAQLLFRHKTLSEIVHYRCTKCKKRNKKKKGNCSCDCVFFINKFRCSGCFCSSMGDCQSSTCRRKVSKRKKSLNSMIFTERLKEETSGTILKVRN